MQETQQTRVRLLGQEGPLEEGMAARSRTVAWRIPWTEEPGGLQSVGHRESDMTEVTQHALTPVGDVLSENTTWGGQSRPNRSLASGSAPKWTQEMRRSPPRPTPAIPAGGRPGCGRGERGGGGLGSGDRRPLCLVYDLSNVEYIKPRKTDLGFTNLDPFL